MDLKEKLLSKIGINDSGCWNWLGSKTANGYGNMRTQFGNMYTHRVSWMVHYGQIPSDLCVLHKCDNKPCVNPEHLFLGTYQDNHNDMRAKGRDAYGHNAKLTRDQVNEVKQLLSQGALSQRQIANLYNVSRSCVLQIRLGNSYA